GFAMHDCLVEKRHPEGEFARVLQLLLDAGSPWDPLYYPTGDPAIDNVLRPRLHLRTEGAALLGDEAAMFRLLSENPGPDNLTRALAGAAKGGHAALCRRLLEAGAPPTGTLVGDTNTPLMYALKANSPETVAVLKEYGA